MVADALQRAAVVANAGNPEAACVLLEEVEASLLHRGSAADEMVETVGAALRSLASVLQRSHRGVWRWAEAAQLAAAATAAWASAWAA